MSAPPVTFLDWALAHWPLVWLAVGLVVAAFVFAYSWGRPLTGVAHMGRPERFVRRAQMVAGFLVFVCAGPVGLVAVVLHAVEDRF